MTNEITEVVDEPELIDAADDITLDRWTKYGHDRLYINGARVEPYIDLQDGSLGDTGRVRVDVEFDGDTATVEIGKEDGHSRHDVIVISLSGEVENEEQEDEVENEKEDEEDTGSNSKDELDRIKTIDEAPGVDTATIQQGDVLELVSGKPGSDGDRFRVKKVRQSFGAGGAMDVEPTDDTESRRDEIVDNGTGPMFKPVMEVER